VPALQPSLPDLSPPAMPAALEFATERHLFYSLVRTFNQGQSNDKDLIYPPRPTLPLKLIIPILRHTECTVPSRMTVSIGRDEFNKFQEGEQEGEVQDGETEVGQAQEGEASEGEVQEGKAQEEESQVSASSDSGPGGEVDSGGTLEMEEDIHIPGAFPTEENKRDGEEYFESDEGGGGEPYEGNELDNQGEEIGGDGGEVGEAGWSIRPALAIRKTDSYSV